MSGRQPKLRGDLKVSQQATAAGTIFVVKEPRTGRFYRLGEAEYFIAGQLDGSTELDTIRQRVEERFSAEVSPEKLGQFIEKLRGLDLLEGGRSEAEKGHGRPRIRGSLLYLRLKAFDPDRWLGYLAHKLRFFFTPHFVGVSAVLLVAAISICLAHWGEIEREVIRLDRFDALLLAWLTVLVVIAAHEFAHGVTCKRFGGEVREMGFMLLYFQPAFYCNVSDAWLFPEKSKRLWVTFAGAYFELFLWALATLTWRVTEPKTWIHFLAFVVMVTSGIKTLFNLNPLIKLDGYYLLSDALEVPNLRQRAFQFLGDRIRKVWGKPVKSSSEPGPRERRIYLVYGLLAAIYSWWLLGLVAWWSGRFLVQRFQGAGFVLFVVLMLVIFWQPFKKLLSRPAMLFRGPRRTLSTVDRGAKSLTSLAGLLLVLFLGGMELKVTGEFKILPAHNADVRAEVEGIIEEVYVDEGDQVRKGEPIATLADRQYRTEMEQLSAEIEEKQARLRMLKTGPRRQEIELAEKTLETVKTKYQHALQEHKEAESVRVEQLAKAQANYAKAEERVKYAKSALKTSETLVAEGLTSRKELEKSQEEAAVRERELEEARAELNSVRSDDLARFKKALAVAEKEVEEAEGRLRVLLAGSRLEEIEAAEAEISRLQTQRDYSTQQLQLVRVVSPVAGVVTTPRPKEKIGAYVQKGDLIVEVHELSHVTAEIAVPEQEITDVRLGQPVVLKARAYPGRDFSGRVAAIAPIATETAGEPGGGRTIRVTSQLDNSALLLKPGMTGNAKVYCGRRSIIHLLTRRVTRYIRVEFWSWW